MEFDSISLFVVLIPSFYKAKSYAVKSGILFSVALMGLECAKFMQGFCLFENSYM